MARPPVAFIGLGALGAPMAANLLAAGVPLTVHNRTRERETPLVMAGAQRAESAAEAVSNARVVMLCLSDGAAVEEVLFGPRGVALGLISGQSAPNRASQESWAHEPGSQEPSSQAVAPLVIDCSTIEPSRTRSLAERLAARGIDWLDAPVTGGTEGARAGTLSVLVGGALESLERARPLLELVGTTITHFGPAGAGQQAKAINQILVAGSYAAVAEAMALGQRLGLPMDDLRQALARGAAGSWALDHRAAGMVAGQFPLGFRLALHRKDLAIALAVAAEAGLELPVCRTVAAMEDALMAAGHGNEDVSALARWFTEPPGAATPPPEPGASDGATAG